MIEEDATKHRYINGWIEAAKGMITRYGNIPFYCDPARPEHIAAFQKAGIQAYFKQQSAFWDRGCGHADAE